MATRKSRNGLMIGVAALVVAALAAAFCMALGVLLMPVLGRGIKPLVLASAQLFSAGVVLLLLMLLWVFAIFWHLTTGTWRHYVPKGSKNRHRNSQNSESQNLSK